MLTSCYIPVVPIQVMWPKHVPLLKQPQAPDSLSFCDPSVQADSSQARVVADVLNGLYCDTPVPFLLRGAFGTGKTRTLVEIAWQVGVHHWCPSCLIAQSLTRSAHLFTACPTPPLLSSSITKSIITRSLAHLAYASNHLLCVDLLSFASLGRPLWGKT